MERDVYTRLIKHTTISYVIYMKADLSKDEYMHAIFFCVAPRQCVDDGRRVDQTQKGISNTEEYFKHRRVFQTQKSISNTSGTTNMSNETCIYEIHLSIFDIFVYYKAHFTYVCLLHRALLIYTGFVWTRLLYLKRNLHIWGEIYRRDLHMWTEPYKTDLYVLENTDVEETKYTYNLHIQYTRYLHIWCTQMIICVNFTLWLFYSHTSARAKVLRIIARTHNLWRRRTLALRLQVCVGCQKVWCVLLHPIVYIWGMCRLSVSVMYATSFYHIYIRYV